MESPNLVLKACMGGKRKLECYGSLLAISDEVGTTSQSFWTLVVSEYPNVFLDELLKIATKREVEFVLI